MGKKKSKYDKLGTIDKMKADREMAEAVGINPNDYNMFHSGGRPGEGSSKKDSEQLGVDVLAALSNDYDYRRSIEAASMAGNKKAKNLSEGIDSLSDAYDAHRFMKKTHRNRMGNGGAYDGANDQAGVTDYWVRKDRDKQMAQIERDYVSKTAFEEMREELEARNEAAEPVEAPELSASLIAAQEGADEYALNLGSQGDQLFGRTDSDDLATAAAEVDASPVSGESEEYKDEYMTNVIDGLKLSGIETRGPKSGINEGEGF